MDNLGIVRKVREVISIDSDNNFVDLRVDPPLNFAQLCPPFDGRDRDICMACVVDVRPDSEPAHEAYRVGKLRQVVFTPQSPVEVFVMEFNAR